MSRRDEVEAELREMDEHHSARFYTNEYSVVAIALADEVDELRAERDRLAAENAELRKRCEIETACQIIVKMEADIQSLIEQLTAANATLDALREVVNQNEWDRAQKGDVLSRFRAILYPTLETTVCATCNGGGGWHAPEYDYAGQCCGQTWVDCHDCAQPEGRDNG